MATRYNWLRLPVTDLDILRPSAARLNAQIGQQALKYSTGRGEGQMLHESGVRTPIFSTTGGDAAREPAV